MSRRLAAAGGVLGPLLLVAYYTAPALFAWPFNGGSQAQISAYAIDHRTVFFAGAWLQVTGTTLSVVFFLALVTAAGAANRLPGILVIVGSSILLALVLVEAALLADVPVAAAAGDSAAASTTFGLVNGVFARVFPLAPASLSYLGLGWTVLGSAVVDRRLGYAAIGIGAAFEVAGTVAVFSPVGLFAAIALSAIQVVWIVVAAVAFSRS